MTPRNVAIIMDGNRRWAAAHGLSVQQGHEAGADTLHRCVRHAAELGIKQLTVFAFSTENWERSRVEVRGLMTLFGARLEKEVPALHRNAVRLQFMGADAKLSASLVAAMRRAEELTRRNDGLQLFVALNYGGRAEILRAAQRYRGGGEKAFRRHLFAPAMADPDVIIRTSGERRISNYLLWQCAYAELIFRDELWPDFSREVLIECLEEYGRRERRFGRSGAAEAA